MSAFVLTYLLIAAAAFLGGLWTVRRQRREERERLARRRAERDALDRERQALEQQALDHQSLDQTGQRRPA